ncbi:MAG: lysoplasmalogenase [Bacteroidetes Order II. Incertae sedis bacterium]|nr:lysoplasmalogenase [Bacteroidetes Order II. bacterium]
MRARSVSGFYAFLGVAYLIGLGGSALSWLPVLLKPLLIPTLMVLVVVHVSHPISTLYRKTLLALFFGWLGDIALMLTDKGEIWFLMGLGCFLIGHLFYIAVFLQTPKPPDYLRRHPVSAWPIVALAVVLLVLLVPKSGALWLPITVYALVIMAMALFALNRKAQVAETSFLLVLAGAVLFMLSDGLIAIDKFVIDLPAASFLIMSTYIAAQYLITTGLIRQTVKSF